MSKRHESNANIILINFVTKSMLEILITFFLNNIWNLTIQNEYWINNFINDNCKIIIETPSKKIFAQIFENINLQQRPQNFERKSNIRLKKKSLFENVKESWIIVLIWIFEMNILNHMYDINNYDCKQILKIHKLWPYL